MSKPLIVVTGGPGAGKTAVLEMLRRVTCPHVAILPEAAGILFSGGFWRGTSMDAHKSAQRAIFHVQRELEFMVQSESKYSIGVCDRGTLDGLAYWPNSDTSFFDELGIKQAEEEKRYSCVIHLRTPSVENGYNQQNPLRIETPHNALLLDKRIEKAWAGHPRRFFVENQADFLKKAKIGLELIMAELPACCARRDKIA
jgi:predicted ATPase